MRVAIVMLACGDYEAMELALVCHAAHLPKDAPLFILQNCRGTYDSERTLMAARRFARLHPGRASVIEDIPPGLSYRSLAALLASERLAPFDLICKVDDDAFPIAPGWLDRLVAAHHAARADGRPLAYTTPLINNNTWGFGATLDALGLREAYLREAAIRHVVGSGKPAAPFSRHRVGLCAHRALAARAHHAGPRPLPRGDRRAARLRRPLRGALLDRLHPLPPDALDRDRRWQHRRRAHAAPVLPAHRRAHRLCAQSVPFVHLAYYSQREENRDIVPRARALYEKRLGLRWPIAMRVSRELEIEARLRYLEGQGVFSAGIDGRGGIGALGGLTPEQFAWRAIRGLWREGLRRIGLKRR